MKKPERVNSLPSLIAWLRWRRWARSWHGRWSQVRDEWRQMDIDAGRDPDFRLNPHLRCGWSYMHPPTSEESENADHIREP